MSHVQYIKYRLYWEIIKFQRSNQQVGSYGFLGVVKHRGDTEPELANDAAVGSAQGLWNKGARPQFASVKFVQEG